jgi:hypothetical protein
MSHTNSQISYFRTPFFQRIFEMNYAATFVLKITMCVWTGLPHRPPAPRGLRHGISHRSVRAHDASARDPCSSSRTWGSRNENLCRVMFALRWAPVAQAPSQTRRADLFAWDTLQFCSSGWYMKLYEVSHDTVNYTRSGRRFVPCWRRQTSGWIASPPSRPSQVHQ